MSYRNLVSDEMKKSGGSLRQKDLYLARPGVGGNRGSDDCDDIGFVGTGSRQTACRTLNRQLSTGHAWVYFRGNRRTAESSSSGSRSV